MRIENWVPFSFHFPISDCVQIYYVVKPEKNRNLDSTAVFWSNHKLSPRDCRGKDKKMLQGVGRNGPKNVPRSGKAQLVERLPGEVNAPSQICLHSLSLSWILSLCLSLSPSFYSSHIAITPALLSGAIAGQDDCATNWTNEKLSPCLEKQLTVTDR